MIDCKNNNVIFEPAFLRHEHGQRIFRITVITSTFRCQNDYTKRKFTQQPVDPNTERLKAEINVQSAARREPGQK